MCNLAREVFFGSPGIYIDIILECTFGYSIIMVRPRQECERGCAVLVEHIYVVFLSLHILEKIVIDFVLKRIDIICRL